MPVWRCNGVLLSASTMLPFFASSAHSLPPGPGESLPAGPRADTQQSVGESIDIIHRCVQMAGSPGSRADAKSLQQRQRRKISGANRNSHGVEPLH